MFDRKKAIQTILACLFEDHVKGNLPLKEIMLDGWRGLNDMTDQELIDELECRDISHVFAECDDEV